jgi:hypothetical protein
MGRKKRFRNRHFNDQTESETRIIRSKQKGKTSSPVNTVVFATCPVPAYSTQVLRSSQRMVGRVLVAVILGFEKRRRLGKKPMASVAATAVNRRWVNKDPVSIPSIDNRETF